MRWLLEGRSRRSSTARFRPGMMMPTRWIVLGAGTCLIMAAGIVASWGSLVARPTPRVVDPRVAELEKSVAQLRREILAQRIGVASDAVMGPHRPAPLHSETTELSQDVSRDEQGRSEAEPATLADFQVRFSSKSSDSSWTVRKEEELRSTLTRSALAKVEGIQCRGALCRVETSHKSNEDAESFLDENERKPGLMDATYYRFPLDQTGTRFVMFVQPNVTQDHRASTDL